MPYFFNKSFLKYLIIFLLIGIGFVQNSYSQKRIFSRLKKKDKKNEYLVKFERISNDFGVFHINDSIKIIENQQKPELWIEDKQPEKWKINNNVEIWMLSEKVKLWIEQDSMWFWQNNKPIEEYKITKQVINKNLSIYNLSPSLLITSTKKRLKLWKRINKIKHWELKPKANSISINDTIKFYFINAQTGFWKHEDSLKVYKSVTPQLMELGSETKIWTINPETELWKNNKETRVWIYDKSKFTWSRQDSTKSHYDTDSIKVFEISPQSFLTFKNDTAKNWVAQKKTIYNIADSMFFWHDPIDPNQSYVPSFSFIISKRKQEKNRFDFFKDTIMWKKHKDTLIWRFDDKYQKWTKNTKTIPWHINDSTSVWTIDNKIRVSITKTDINCWEVNDSSKVWEKKIKPQSIWLADSFFVSQIDTVHYVTIVNDTINVWDINTNIKSLSESQSKRKWDFDKTKVLEVDSLTRLSISENEKHLIEHDTSRKFTRINPKTLFYRHNESLKLSFSGDSIVSWPPLKNTKSRWSNDNTKVIEIEPYLELWRNKDSLSFWKKNTEKQIFMIDDSVFLWGFTPPPPTTKPAKPKYWKFGGTGNVNFAQGYFNNWVKGGESNITTLSVLKLFMNYAKNKTKFENNIEINLGIMKPGSKDWRKNEDKIVYNTKLGRKAFRKWYYTLSADMKTQFFDGYKYPNDSVPVSAFMSPFVMEYGIGLDYSPAFFFSLNLSPLSSKFTYVADTARINQENHGVDKDKKHRHEPGFYLKAKLKYDITKNILVESKLNLFTNYVEKPENVDIDWQTNITMKINEYITSNVSLHMIYDHDVAVPIVEMVNGVETKRTGPRLQTKELLSVGFSYKF